MVPITSSPAWPLGQRSVWCCFFLFLSLIHLTKDNHTCLCQMPGTGKEKSALTWIVCSTVEKIVQSRTHTATPGGQFQKTCKNLPLTMHTQNSLPLPAGVGWCRTLQPEEGTAPLQAALFLTGALGSTWGLWPHAIFPSHQSPCIPEQMRPWEAVVWTSWACSQGQTQGPLHLRVRKPDESASIWTVISLHRARPWNATSLLPRRSSFLFSWLQLCVPR